MERAIELVAGVQFLIIGLSHLFQPKVWVEFFIMLREKGHKGVFINGFLSLTFGSLIVGFHNVWAGLPMVLTLIGYAQLIKATIAFVLPAVSMRTFQRVSVERAWEFQVAGVVAIGLGGLFMLMALRSHA